MSTLAQNLTLCACVVVVSQSDRALFESHVTASELKLDIARSWTMAVKGKKLCNVSIVLWQFSSGNKIQSSIGTYLSIE